MEKKRKGKKKPVPIYDFRWTAEMRAREGGKKMAKYHRNLTEQGYILRETPAGTLIYEKFSD